MQISSIPDRRNADVNKVVNSGNEAISHTLNPKLTLERPIQAQIGIIRMREYPMISQLSNLRANRGRIHRKIIEQPRLNKPEVNAYIEYSVVPG